MGKLESFIEQFSGLHVPQLSDIELRDICYFAEINKQELPEELILQTIQCLSYLALNEGEGGRVPLKTIEILMAVNSTGKDDTLHSLIEKLKPLLLRIDVNDGKKSASGLKPRVGMSFKEDEARRVWKETGGLQSLPLFYVVLLHLKNRDVSSNLWWITPGILNILDDTTDLICIKLRGVLLLKTFLSHSFEDQVNWISFVDTGLFQLYEPILLNMCYFIPPAYSSENSLRTLKIVFPTLNLLYRLRFQDSEIKYKYHLGKFLSEILLQNIIPRINITSEELTKFALDAMINIIEILQVSTVCHLQRIIYTLGEYLVQNPFFTAFSALMEKTLHVLESLVEVCPNERIIAHKYDFLALLLITYEKCKYEGKLSGDIVRRIKRLLQSLESKGCDYANDKLEVLKQKDMKEVFG